MNATKEQMTEPTPTKVDSSKMEHTRKEFEDMTISFGDVWKDFHDNKISFGALFDKKEEFYSWHQEQIEKAFIRGWKEAKSETKDINSGL